MDEPDADASRPPPEGAERDAVTTGATRDGVETAGTTPPAVPPDHRLEAIARELVGGAHHPNRCTLVRLQFAPTVPVSRRRGITDRIGRAITVHDGVQRDDPVPVADLLVSDEYDAAPLADALAGIAEVDGVLAVSSIPVRP